MFCATFRRSDNAVVEVAFFKNPREQRSMLFDCQQIKGEVLPNIMYQGQFLLKYDYVTKSLKSFAGDLLVMLGE
jgi:hypothetical protein